MRVHPAVAMLLIWGMCIAAFFILPFNLTSRTLTLNGFLILFIFILVFCLGSFLRSPILRAEVQLNGFEPDFSRADFVLKTAATIAVLALTIDFLQGNFSTLVDSFMDRSARATAMLTGAKSSSSFWFKIGFLLYPVGIVMVVREIVYEKAIRFLTLCFFGLLPIVLAAVVMGGRGPLLFGLFALGLSYRVRAKKFKPTQKTKPRSSKNFVIGCAIFVMGIVAMNYFVNVFIARAEVAGGTEEMFFISSQIWGVDFSGPGSNFVVNLIGEGNTYLIFVFIWYLVQGLVMSNVLFSDFAGPPTYGIYGVDLLSAVARRIDSNFVADRFLTLLDLDVYGFLPSAFGSLYVDFLWFGLIPTFIWGYLCSIVYQRSRTNADSRWQMLGPMVMMGIIFSVINTPIGFGNGMVTHFWFIVMFLLSKPAARRNYKRDPRRTVSVPSAR
ncbi:MAG: oligosaccharide repeat unit polymerase [Novosphingobium sp.]|nr:oligosaccharide repeat unit polymerase [Novosphingobium sp.]